MVFKKGTPDYGKKGYLYIVEKEKFKPAMGTQYVAFENIEPLEIIEIDVDEHLEICIVEKQD